MRIGLFDSIHAFQYIRNVPLECIELLTLQCTDFSIGDLTSKPCPGSQKSSWQPYAVQFNRLINIILYQYWRLTRKQLGFVKSILALNSSLSV